MFYVSELNLKDKGPLSRLWQACHSSKNVNRKIAAEFKYEDGYDAIVQPANQNQFALRLSAKLLLGLSRLHRAKVDYFQEDIKQTHDRITLSFKLVASSAVDQVQPTGKKLKARVDAITMAVDNDLDIHFDISDELPEWLVSDVLELPAPISNASQDAGLIDSQSRRSAASRSINLPDRSSELGYPSTADDIFTDILEVPGGEMPPELDIDFFSESVDNISGKLSSINNLRGEASIDEHFEISSPPQHAPQPMDLDPQEDSITKKAKRKSKSKLQEKTEIEKDEIRKWVAGLPEYMANIVRKPLDAPYKHEVPLSVEQIISQPVLKLGKRLRNFVMVFGLENNPDLLRSEVSNKRKKTSKEVQDPTSKLAESERAIEYAGDQDYYNEEPGMFFEQGGSGGYGDSESAGGRSSFLLEGPERMRAGSDEMGQGPDLMLGKGRRSSDILGLPGRFEFDPSQSPRGSSVKSHRSRLTSVGEMDLSLQIPGLSVDDEDSLFKDGSLQEEPESMRVSQLSSTQRLSNNDLLVARHVANGLAQTDGGELSFFQLVGIDADARKAARVFYSMLSLQNDNIIHLDQDTPYEDITIRATANTSMYAYAKG